jgi:MFS transporter, OFA family, oxalate/formate antiporter
MKNRRGILADIGSAGAIFWPGAFLFGYPGVMGSFWQQQFGG